MAHTMYQRLDRLSRLIGEQQEWIEDHGTTLKGYRQRYGDHDLDTCYGDGGTAIYQADTAELAKREAEARTMAAAAFRRSVRALRQISHNAGRTAATTSAVNRRVRTRDAAIGLLLMVDGGKELAGLLTEEAKLSDRVADARADGQQRPELAARLRQTRATIGTILAPPATV